MMDITIQTNRILCCAEYLNHTNFMPLADKLFPDPDKLQDPPDPLPPTIGAIIFACIELARLGRSAAVGVTRTVRKIDS
jgi:hypothetical protein